MRLSPKPGVVATLVALCIASGCGNPFGADDTRIRLRNASQFELTNVTFAPGTPRLEFARIAPGAATEYRPVEGAYRYGYLDVLVGGERRQLRPIDYVGESEIGEGDFTYVITIDATTRYPAVELRRDD
jgi:hypothetical protein